MCVIIFKPKGAGIPSERELRAAKFCHPHGFGFVSSSGIHYRGFDFGKFMTLLEMVPTEDECVIHFRFATHGTVKKSNCHPFYKEGVWFAHNGILNIAPIGDKTDSETAFIKYIYPTVHDYGLDSPETESIIGAVIGCSKFAIMENGRTRLFGDFYEHDGRLYSNLRHVRTGDFYNNLFKAI